MVEAEDIGSVLRPLTTRAREALMANSQPTTAIENWKPVVGFEGAYEVSDRGRVFSLPRRTRHWRGGTVARGGKMLALAVGEAGYPLVSLGRDGRISQHLVHRLVLEAFVGPCPKGMECCHEDGVRTNNRLSNLRWDTRKANHADAIRHGTHSSVTRWS